MQGEPIKILFINGSPNQEGNTATVMKWVEEGILSSGAESEWLQVTDLDVHYCKGCNMCLKMGVCIQVDDMVIVKEKIKLSDGVVVGSPVYEGYPTAQLKTIQDRVALQCLYLGLFDDKWAVGVSTSGIAPTNKTAKLSAEPFGKLAGTVSAKTASLKRGYQRPDKKRQCDIYDKARKSGERLVKNIKQNPLLSAGRLKSVWIDFLRKHFLKKMIVKNPDLFSGVIEEWKKRGWLD